MKLIFVITYFSKDQNTALLDPTDPEYSHGKLMFKEKFSFPMVHLIDSEFVLRASIILGEVLDKFEVKQSVDASNVVSLQGDDD